MRNEMNVCGRCKFYSAASGGCSKPAKERDDESMEMKSYNDSCADFRFDRWKVKSRK